MKLLRNFPDIDIYRNQKAYDAYIDQFKMEDGWDEGNKEFNYNELIKLVELTKVPLQNTTCLDIGCGTGDFSAFLRNHSINDYVGIDIYKPSLAKAYEKYPQETFILGDFLAGDVEENTKNKILRFDYAFCSGAMTLRLASEDNYDFLYSVVKKMWEMTKIGIAFNVLSDTDTMQDPDLFFYSKDKVIEICKAIDKSANLQSLRTPHVAQEHFYMYR